MLRLLLLLTLFALATGTLFLRADDGPIFSDAQLTYRTFPVRAGFFELPFVEYGSPQQQLSRKGIDFGPEASAVYVANSGTLVVINTPEEVQSVRRLVHSWNKSPFDLLR